MNGKQQALENQAIRQFSDILSYLQFFSHKHSKPFDRIAQNASFPGHKKKAQVVSPAQKTNLSIKRGSIS
jgi:hypothetical protein